MDLQQLVEKKLDIGKKIQIMEQCLNIYYTVNVIENTHNGL